MKYSTSTVLAAVGAATAASSDAWGTWDPKATTTTTASSKWAWPAAASSTTSAGKVWDPKKSSTTAATEWPEWTTSADPAWTSPASPAETSSWASWDPVDPVDPAQCSAYSTSTVWADPSGAWGAFPTTLTETDTVTVWVGPNGPQSTEFPAGWGADPSWTGAWTSAAPAATSSVGGGAWGGEWPADPTESVIATNAASWVWTAPIPSSTDWMPNGPDGLQCGDAHNPLPEPGCNTAADRSTWCGGVDIDTDYYETCPTTGNTVTYNFVITNGTASPDGDSRLMFLINGQSPGPLIEANWGDTVSITVTNQLQNNGTEIHWHGIRQFGTNSADGVPGITACPLAPGETKTYTWQACQYGSSWYHSHWLTQYGDGIKGPIVIHGPATDNYDIDMGPVMISDLFYPTAAGAYDWISHVGPGGSKNYLLNGVNTDVNNTKGQHALWQLQPGKKHLFRLVNSAAQNMFSVHFDGHEIEVIASDFVPIKPYTTDWLNIAIGQRYDVIITANAASGNYFLRAVTQTGCPASCDNNGLGSANGILQYAGATLTLPQSNFGSKTIQDFAICTDEPPASLVPWVSKDADSDAFAAQVSTLPAGNVVPTQTSDDGLIFRWFLNNGFMDVDFTNPSLQTIANGGDNSSISNSLFIGGTKDTWVYFVIQNQFFAGHPIHLHGHDFYVLGQKAGSLLPPNAPGGSPPILFSQADVASLNFQNPPRRDTAMLVNNGWTVIGFQTDNPGTWLMHCHIVWHIDGGLGLQFVERESEIKDYVDSAFSNTCSAYASYEASSPAHQKTGGESGLRKRWMDNLMYTGANDVVRRAASNAERRYLDSHLKRGLGDSHKHHHV